MKYLKSKKFYLILAVLILGGLFGYNKFFKNRPTQYNTAKVVLGTLKQTVTETGSTKHASEVSLNFLAQGRLAKTSVTIGSKVKKDQVLAELDYTNLKIQAKQAQANVEVARASEQKVLSGATFQDINIGQSAVNQAEVSLANAKKDLIKTSEADQELLSQVQKNYNDLSDPSINTPAEASVNSALVSLNKNKTTYQKTITNRADSLLVATNDKIYVAKNALANVNRILTDENAKDTLSITNSQKLIAAKANYAIAMSQDPVATQLYESASASKNSDDIKSASEATVSYLTKAIVALNDTFGALDNSIASSKFPQSQLDAFKSTISSQISLANAGLSVLEQSKQALDDAVNSYDSVIANSQENLNIADANLISSRTAALNALNNAKLSLSRNFQSGKSRVDASQEALKIAQAQLSKTASGSRSEDINLARAQVKQAQANLDGVLNQINNSIIKAPFEGQITQVNYDVGEEPNATRPVFVLMGENQFEIQVDISESDIAKVALGNIVEIDFDAFGEGIKFSGKLDDLDPAQTIIQEVVYYRGTVRDITTSSTSKSYLKQIKSGMTANLTIMAKQKDNVMVIPFRAVTDNNGVRTVKVYKNDQTIETPVSLGLKGDDGIVEILSGLSLGDEIILSTKTD